MVLLTDELKAYAGDALRAALVRFTGTPSKAFASGALVTLLVQSSSATMVTLIGLVNAGLLSFPQVVGVVMGASLGATVTGALAAIGGSTSAKRTALTHVLFNLATGVIAILLLPLLLWGLGLMQARGWLEPGAVSLAAFHTTFIALGVALFLPYAEPIARRIERLLPERGPHLTRHLDDSLLAAPPVALEATRRTLIEIELELIDLLDPLLQGANAPIDPTRRAAASQALARTQLFFA